MRYDKIASTADWLDETAFRIAKLAKSLSESDGDNDICEEFLLDEITHVQILALELTRLSTEEGQSENEDGDGGAFAEGELNSVLGEKKVEYPEDKEEEKERWN